MSLEYREGFTRQRIAVDLDETLIFNPNPLVTDTLRLRTGATKLLEGLRNIGLEVVLYTTASRKWVNYVFGLFPDIEGFFENIYCEDNTPGVRISRGIKDPAYVNADLFIDNYIHKDIQVRLGPRAIQVPCPSESESDEWAAETLDRVGKILGR